MHKWNQIKLIHGGVFNWAWKVISKLLWFCITSLSDWFKVLALFFQPITSETKTNHGSLVHIFPCFVSAMCNYFEFWLVYWIGWLAKVISFILQHSIETCSIESYCILRRGENQSTQRKTSWSREENQQTQPTLWCQIWGLTSGHIGGRRVSSPLRHPH